MLAKEVPRLEEDLDTQLNKDGKDLGDYNSHGNEEEDTYLGMTTKGKFQVNYLMGIMTEDFYKPGRVWKWGQK